jgi:hypothetical protein
MEWGDGSIQLIVPNGKLAHSSFFVTKDAFPTIVPLTNRTPRQENQIVGPDDNPPRLWYKVVGLPSSNCNTRMYPVAILICRSQVIKPQGEAMCERDDEGGVVSRVDRLFVPGGRLVRKLRSNTYRYCYSPSSGVVNYCSILLNLCRTNKVVIL